jgi:hypothetical protein
MEREKMLNFLIDNELRFLLSNPDKHTLSEMVDFFTRGGYLNYTDDELLSACEKQEFWG